MLYAYLYRHKINGFFYAFLLIYAYILLEEEGEEVAVFEEKHCVLLTKERPCPQGQGLFYVKQL